MEETLKIKSVSKIVLILAVSLLVNCGYNRIQELDEEVNAQMAEILNQYKRRADLIPGLVKIVEGYASHEKEVLVEIAKARSGVGGLQATPELLNNPEAFKNFQNAQNSLGSALQRLLVVTERYPELKANEGFRDLQAQLEGTENRIAVARGRYIKSVQEYNVTIRQFPTVITAKMFGYGTKSSFTTENESDIKNLPSDIVKPPEMDFGKKKDK
ncbi:MAG: LemA family protein [Leptospiraceae bacterium]|nr:LemA family protein [Leptospiraceae bacterium]